MPGSRVDYWRPKLDRNLIRDAANQRRLKEEGWKVLVIWECELKDLAAVKKTVNQFLGRSKARKTDSTC